MVSEKSPLAKRSAFQLKPGSVFCTPLLKEATLEPLLVQLAWMRDVTVWPPGAGPGRLALQGSVAFALGPDCISLGHTVKKRRLDGSETQSFSQFTEGTERNFENSAVLKVR